MAIPYPLPLPLSTPATQATCDQGVLVPFCFPEKTMLVRWLSLIFIQISLVEGIVHQRTEEIMSRNKAIQYNTIKILLSTPHGGFSETYINSTGNKKKTLKNCQ